jgi:hypothetical protein
MEVNTDITAKGKMMAASSGSETMACLTLRLHGNPGGPVFLSEYREYAGQLKKKEGKWDTGNRIVS